MNRIWAMRLLVDPYRVLHEDRTVLLGIAVRDGLGELFLYRKAERVLTFYLQFREQESLLGRTATQVAVWRRAAPGLVGGTSRITNFLLDDYDIVVSAASVTPAGQRYWIDRMAEAEVEGMSVGLIRGGDFEPFPKEEWFEQADAWGNDEASKDLRYFISKKPLGDQ